MSAITHSSSGTAAPDIVVYQHRSAKQQQIARAGDRRISAISDATANMTAVPSAAVYQQRQRSTINNGD